MISQWEYWALLTWEVDKGIFNDLRRFVCRFQSLQGPLRAFKGPQWFSKDKLVCLEKSRWNILLQDDFPMGILSVTHLRGGQRDIKWFEAFFFCFQAMKGPLMGPPMVLNGQTSMPWEVEIRYSTMEWFHYGNTERYSLERWTKEYLMIWGFFVLFSGYGGPLRVPNGSQWTN